jgi:hypothetical protein
MSSKAQALSGGDHLLDLGGKKNFDGGADKVRAIVGEDKWIRAGTASNQTAQEVCGRLARHLLV